MKTAATTSTTVAWRDRVDVLRPKWHFIALGVALLASAVPIIVLAFASGVYSILVSLIHSLLFGTMSLSYGNHSIRGASSTQGTLSVDAEALQLDGQTIARRDELTQGFVMATDDGILVRLDRKGIATFTRPVFVRVRDEDQGRSLLRALGFDADQTAAQIKIASALLGMSIPKQLGLVGLPIGLFLASILLIASIVGPPAVAYAIPLLITVLCVWCFTIAFSPTKVHIGTDGVFTSWLGRKRFYPFSSIASAGIYDDMVGSKRYHGVRLTLKDGAAPVNLCTGQTDIGKAEARRVHHRILEASHAHDAGARAPALKDVLVRGERSLADWVRELRRLGAGAHDHRTAAVPIDILLRVLEDTTAPAQDRASAAIAVRSNPNEEVAKRIRVAAETSASPQLRIALTRIAEAPSIEDNDEELARTLEQLSASQ